MMVTRALKRKNQTAIKSAPRKKVEVSGRRR
jgi:hypothetical protein